LVIKRRREESSNNDTKVVVYVQERWMVDMYFLLVED